MKRYQKYKDSGVEWLGEVPEGWLKTRIKTIANINPVKDSQIDKDSTGLVTFLPMEAVGVNSQISMELKEANKESIFRINIF